MHSENRADKVPAAPAEVVSAWAPRLQHILNGGTLLGFNAKYNVPLIDVSPASNQCLYRCLSLAIYGTPDNWENVKMEAISYIHANFQDLDSWLLTHDRYGYTSADAYLRDMLLPNAMGTAAEAYVLGRIHRFTVVVVNEMDILRQSIVDDPNFPAMTLFLAGSYLSGHFKLGVFFPEQLRQEVFAQALEDDYCKESPFLKTKFIPGINYPCPLILPNSGPSKVGNSNTSNVITPGPSKPTPKKNISRTPSKEAAPTSPSSPCTPNSSARKTPTPSRRKQTDAPDSTTPSKRRRTKTPNKTDSARKNLFGNGDEGEDADDPDVIEADFNDPTKILEKPGHLDFLIDSDSDDGENIDLQDAQDTSTSDGTITRRKKWLPLPPTDS